MCLTKREGEGYKREVGGGGGGGRKCKKVLDLRFSTQPTVSVTSLFFINVSSIASKTS